MRPTPESSDASWCVPRAWHYFWQHIVLAAPQKRVGKDPKGFSPIQSGMKDAGSPQEAVLGLGNQHVV